MIVRPAVQSDVPELVEMAETFIEESAYEIEFDVTNSAYHYMNYILSPGGDVLVAKQDGAMVGGVMVASSTEFQKKPFGYVGKFYVIPEARRGTASRSLIAAMLDWFTLQDVSHVFVTATAGLEERDQRAFILLMKRSGFVEEGPVMYKVMEG
mgnify:CR=1 FL=1|jgi:L-amino acid N-acyltransferase YncA|tara:strand:+ start:823 stop:1281 length:459 start_codon:yes stop_codon:yes gene_type:complete